MPFTSVSPTLPAHWAGQPAAGAGPAVSCALWRRCAQKRRVLRGPDLSGQDTGNETGILGGMKGSVFFGFNNMRQDMEAEGRVRCLGRKATPRLEFSWTERGTIMRA